MIDIRKLKELIRLMVANDLTELDLRDNEEQVTLRRPGAQAPQFPVPAHAPPVPMPAAPEAATEAHGEASADDHLHRIESPMVGTFYATPSPDAQPYVKVGDHIDGDTVVCIIEAMKIFNEIKAECSGTIRSVLVETGQAVEFGQPLFSVEPD